MQSPSPTPLDLITSSGSRCLFVSENRLRRLVLIERTVPLGIRTQVCGPNQLWTTLHRFAPDLVVLDDQLSGQNFDDISETVLSDPMLSGLPIVRTRSGSNGEPNWNRTLREIGLRLGVPPLRSPLAPGHLRRFGRILLLDPHRRFSRELQVRLNGCGLAVERVFGGLDGFDAAIRWEPDLIITEFLLPKALGSWVLGRLRDCGRTMPVVFLTETSPSRHLGMTDTLRELGAAAVLPKPILFPELIACIGSLIPLPDEVFREVGVSVEPDAQTVPGQSIPVQTVPGVGGHVTVPAPHFPFGVSVQNSEQQVDRSMAHPVPEPKYLSTPANSPAEKVVVHERTGEIQRTTESSMHQMFPDDFSAGDEKTGSSQEE